MSPADPGSASATPSAAGAEVRIDRLALDVPGLGAADAERLALRVAAHLARAGVVAGNVALPRLQVVLQAPEADLDRLAARIARAVLGA